MPNRSLDDFAGGGTDEETTEDETAEDETVDAETAEDETTVEASEPDVETLATYRWTPTGTTCPQCDASVEKTWLDGDEYVCGDCKNW